MSHWSAMRRRTVGGGLAISLAMSIACTGGAAADWPVYHRDNGRSGNDTSEPLMSNAAPSWGGDGAHGLDGAVYAEPLVVGGTVVVPTEQNTIYAFTASTGAASWSTHLASPVSLSTIHSHGDTPSGCGNIDPLGITGTPVADQGYLYAVAETLNGSGQPEHRLFKLDLNAGGTSVWPGGVLVDPPSMAEPYAHQQRAALAVAGGQIIIAYGGLIGDCGNYHGYLVSYPETGGTLSEWHTTPHGRMGGIWGASGPAVDGAGNVYVATGNGDVGGSTPCDNSSYVANSDYSDAVVKLTPTLTVTDFFAPTGKFTPPSWCTDNASDTDLASVGPILVGGNQVFALGKSGIGYLLNQAGLGGLYGSGGGGEVMSHQVCHATSDAAFGGMAYAPPYVFVPCSDGIAAVQVDGSTGFHVSWYQTASGHEPPAVGGGIVWVLNGSTLNGLSPTGGSPMVSLRLPGGGSAHFRTPAIDGGHVFVATGAELYAFASPSVYPAPPGSGYVLDGWGGLHPFAGSAPLAMSDYWLGWDIARGVVMRPSDRLGGFVLDGYGGIHRFGNAPAVATPAYWSGWDIARAISIDPCDASGNSGYVLDGWGGVHSFGGAPPMATQNAYWHGWDIARALAFAPCVGGVRRGYVLDGWGGIHGISSAGPSPDGANSEYWHGWDIARRLVVNPCDPSGGSGYVLDGWGGIHPFGGAPAVSHANAYWSGWDIARGMVTIGCVSGSVEGYVLDGWGGVHGFSTGGAISDGSTSAYWRGWDIARGATA